MITIDLGLEAGPGPTTIARRLIAEGADPDEILRVMRCGTQCFLDYPLRKWAGLMVREGKATSAKLLPYRKPSLEAEEENATNPESESLRQSPV